MLLTRLVGLLIGIESLNIYGTVHIKYMGQEPQALDLVMLRVSALTSSEKSKTF